MCDIWLWDVTMTETCGYTSKWIPTWRSWSRFNVSKPSYHVCNTVMWIRWSSGRPNCTTGPFGSISVSPWWRHQMETFSALLAIFAGNSPVPEGQWRGALMFSLIWVWINGWVNNREAGDLRRHRAHCDVIVMLCCNINLSRPRQNHRHFQDDILKF